MEAEGTKLEIDRELLRLRKLVALNAALFGEGEIRQATDLDRQQYGRVEDNAEALLWDSERQAWWQACEQQRRAKRRRLWRAAAVAAVVVGAFAYFAVGWVEEAKSRAELLSQVEKGEVEAAYSAILALTKDGIEISELHSRLKDRNLAALLEAGPGEEALDFRPVSRLLTMAAVAQPLAESDDIKALSLLLWSLDYVAAEGTVEQASQAQELRGEVLATLREGRAPPPLIGEESDWVDIEGGTFTMGSPDEVEYDDERPAHEVTVSPFRMLGHEVTTAEVRQLFPKYSGEANRPAVNVTWHRAYAYAAWLGGRLPTEAEWEYAARANCTFEYCDSEGREARLAEVGWYGGNSDSELKTGCSAEKPRNSFGLCDMIGNAWEWTADWYEPYSEEAVTNPWGPSHGEERVIRGGSYGSTAVWTRAAYRARNLPGNLIRFQGFRVVLPRP